MKKLIAILAAIAAVSGVSAFGQDWISFQTAGTTIWDNSAGVTALDAAGAGKIDAVLLFTTTGAADQLTSYGTSFGLRGSGTALDQVGTNALSVNSPNAAINSMLSSGWSIAFDEGAGTNAVATSGTGTLKGQVSYNAGAAFQIANDNGASGSTITEIVLAYNAGAAGWSSAADIGWSNPFNTVAGTSAADPETSSSGQSSANQFAIAAVPEPTTLALAALGGLSMLGLRRRKA